MIYKRAIAKLRAQDWLAIAIELTIVVVGVFIGTWVANWNQERAGKAETRRMVEQLKPSLNQLSTYFRSARDYYAVTRAYSGTAIAGWRADPRVSDADFLIAAYQASQINTLGTNSSTFSTILGADRLHDIDDTKLRADLSRLMSADYTQIDQVAVDTPYRRNVRRIIPVEIQDAIRKQCGDRARPDNLAIISLSRTCHLAISPVDARKAAALLRGHPELMEDLQWQIAATATFLENVVAFEDVVKRIEKRSSSGAD